MAIVNTHYGYCGSRAPILAGSWLFNNVLTAFPSGLYENVNFTATGGGDPLTCTTIGIFVDDLGYTISDGGGNKRVYDYGKKRWLNNYKTITFAENATVSEEFMNWLTANATKQS